MSELIDNRHHRQEVLKKIIKDLHAGVDPADVKERFAELLDQVGATEISEIEQLLIDEGLPIEEVQALCDVHVSVFRESLDRQREAEKSLSSSNNAHPLNLFKEENQMITNMVERLTEVVEGIGETLPGEDITSEIAIWRKQHTELGIVDAHYSRKENILFPYLERNSITGPPSVMWGIHDEIRADLKKINKLIQDSEKVANPQLSRAIADDVLPFLNQIGEMVYKEENILFPMCMETLTADEWEEVRVQMNDPDMVNYKKPVKATSEAVSAADVIELDVGRLTPEQINLVLTHLPLDITYVDEKDEVAYFSLGAERIFERAPAVIGRNVQNCHPPASMHVVNQIVSDFKSGKRDTADFWINMGDKMVYIRYFAVRDKEGKYRGVLEVTQNISEIRELEGEKRIYDDNPNQE